ncbi:MAG: lysophospholipase [Treponema sp.]|nr:lysophospholipase [Treponema sp.]
MYSHAFGRIEEACENRFHTYITWNDIDQNKYPRETVFFKSGKNKLQGFLYGGSNNNGLIIISQGLGNTADHYLTMIMFFVDRGWSVFAYNNTGVSGSEGSGVIGLTQSLFDLDAALAFVRKSEALRDLPIMLVGHSWGGFAVCAIFNFDFEHNIKAVVSFAGFNNGNEVIDKLAVSRVGRIYNILSRNVAAIERQLFGEAAKLTAVDGINRANTPFMIVQSSNDDVIFADSISIFAHRDKITNPNVEIVFLDGDDVSGHEFVFGSREQREYIKWAAASWRTFRTENRNATRHQWAEKNNFDVFKANQLNMELMEQINIFFYSWRGFNTPPNRRFDFRAFSKGIKPESNTFREQHTSSLQGEVVDNAR